MKADPEWRAFVEKKRAEEKNTQANPVFQGRALGFFVAENQLVNDAFEIQKPVKIDQKHPEIDHKHSAIDHEHSATDREHSVINHDHSMFHQTSYDPLHDRWLVDTGAQVHICNNRRLFVEFQKTTGSIRVGDTKTIVEGIGTVSIYGISPGNEAPLRMDLFNVKYSPGFHTNIIAHGQMFETTGAFLNFKKDWIEHEGIPLYATYRDQKLPWLVQPNQPLVNAVKKSAREPTSEASIEIWHRRLGHVSKERIEKLTEMTEGVKIAGSNPENQVCEACHLANAPRQISRRKIGQAYGVLGRVHFDLVQNQPAYNRHVWLTHFYLDGIRCHFVFTHVKKKDCQWAVRKFIALIRNWLNVKIKVFHYDNERSAGNEVENMIEAEGCDQIHV